MQKISCTILLLLVLVKLNAQEILPQKEAKFITRFPFKQYSGGVMMIKAVFANLPDTLNFILDTGSGGISLDSTTCADLHITITKSDTTITGIGGVHKVPFTFDKTLTMPGLKIEHLNFHINNYEVLSSVYGEKVDGIIGYSFFSRYIVKIDFETLMIEVFSPGKIEYPKRGTTLHPAFTNLPIQWLNIKDKRHLGFNFYIDTGAGLYLLLSEKFVQDSAILFARRKPVTTQAQGMAGKLQMKLTVIKELKVGPYKFKFVPVYLYKDDYNVTSYPFTGGLLGNDLLRRFNLIFNYPNREIHLLPNRHYNDDFDYTYTGLGIFYVNNKIMVEDVIAGSPAEKAGFRVDDEILAINKNFTKNIQVYKDLLQKPNETIKVIVIRNGAAQELTLNTITIF
jgi:hypothetical protein